MTKLKMEDAVFVLATEYVRKTARLNENSTPDDFAKEFFSAFRRIDETLQKLVDEFNQSKPKAKSFPKSDLGL